MKRSATAAVLVALSGCGSFSDEQSREEVAWANSPDGRTHAILIETNGGATTSFGYTVELHPTPHDGTAPVTAGQLYGAVRSDCAYGVDLHWLSPDTLALRFQSAKRAEVPTTVTLAGRTVRIATQPGRINPSAPCGGMAARS